MFMGRDAMARYCQVFSLDRLLLREGCVVDVTFSRQARCVSAQAFAIIPPGPAKDRLVQRFGLPFSLQVGDYPHTAPVGVCCDRAIFRDAGPCATSRGIFGFQRVPLGSGKPSRAGDSDRPPVSAGVEFHPQSSARDL